MRQEKAVQWSKEIYEGYQFLTRLAGSHIPCTNKEDLLVKLLNLVILKRRLLWISETQKYWALKIGGSTLVLLNTLFIP